MNKRPYHIVIILCIVLPVTFLAALFMYYHYTFP
ncbi:MAG: putative lysis protein [Apeevirus fundihabitans]|uniref:Lysis protein n=1 Tax=Leviviridae sp. TaxID=2027243 RepID=A0ABY3SSY3_9VIRU|nr:MAG: putative lysis protein [Leviviridae sp.]